MNFSKDSVNTVTDDHELAVRKAFLNKIFSRVYVEDTYNYSFFG